MIEKTNTVASSQENAGGKAAFPVRRKLSTTAADLQAERDGLLPVWIRAPKAGPEFYTGVSRAKLYEWATKGYIKSVSVREPGQVKGCRFFLLSSVCDFLARCEAEANASAEASSNPTTEVAQ